MNTLKRTLALVATLAMASTAFVACGDDKSEGTNATTAPATTAPATQGETQAPTEAEPVAGGHFRCPAVNLNVAPEIGAYIHIV